MYGFRSKPECLCKIVTCVSDDRKDASLLQNRSIFCQLRIRNVLYYWSKELTISGAHSGRLLYSSLFSLVYYFHVLSTRLRLESFLQTLYLIELFSTLLMLRTNKLECSKKTRSDLANEGTHKMCSTRVSSLKY